MIVEFVGVTGAGKTTLVSAVQRRLVSDTAVETGSDVAVRLIGLQHVTHPTVRNLAQDLVGLPFFFRALPANRRFVAFALGIVARQCRVSFSLANYTRSIVRKIGMHELVARHRSDQIVLVDEGTVLSAHLLFVYGCNAYSQQELGAFASLVPLPDMIVYVTAPLDILVERSAQRRDKRRELRSKDLHSVKEYLERGTQVFDQLVEADRLRGRVVVVPNQTSTLVELGIAADRIARLILNCRAAGSSASDFQAGQIEPGPATGGRIAN